MRIAVVSNTAWYRFNFRLNLMQDLQAAGRAVECHEPIGDDVCWVPGIFSNSMALMDYGVSYAKTFA